MAHSSSEFFRAFHALRIKGFAGSDTVAEVAGLSVDQAEAHLKALLAAEQALFRENRSLWQLTPAGKEAHKAAIVEDVPKPVAANLHHPYQTFLQLNDSFKVLCTDWQLRDGEPNDHADDEYDEAVIARLYELDETAQPVVAELSSHLDRLSPYGPRLTGARQRLVDGNLKMITGVMCNSYHDVWMELHEDLILSQQIDRAAEGSF
jgi:hypothetical protein